MMREPLLATQPSRKGGFRALPFIIANESFEKVASYGILPNMILYLMQEYGMQMSTGTNILFFWSAATNFTPTIGAFVADSYIGRFHMIGFGSIMSLLGMTLLWSTTVMPGAKPSCNRATNTSCTQITPFQLIFLCTSFTIMSIGAGGIRSSSLAFGADQIKGVLRDDNYKDDDDDNDNIEYPNKIGLISLETFFQLYYVSFMVSVLVSLTLIVYIQDNMGWRIGFGVPVLLMFFSTMLFFLASPVYVKLKAKSTSLITGFARVIVASWRNRRTKRFVEDDDQVVCYYYGNKVSADQYLIPSQKLRFLNKACIVTSPDQELTSEGKAIDPWKLCTVDQVEELKSLLRVIPLWSTGIMLSVNYNQGSIRVLQANSMDRHLTQNFEIPAGSFGIFGLMAMILWVALYDYFILPLASRSVGKPVRMGTKTRMGIGLVLSFLSLVVSAIVEGKRRDHQKANMSAFWLVPQCCLFGLAETFTAIAQNEFFYSECSKSLSSIASNLFGLGVAVASLVASFILTGIHHVTRVSNGKESWVSNDVNKGRYDYYYWVLAALSLVNFVYFLACSRAYGPCKGRLAEKGLDDS